MYFSPIFHIRNEPFSIYEHICTYIVLHICFTHDISVWVPKTKKDLNIAANYRPISLLSIFCKIFETRISRRITNFLTKNKIGRASCRERV